MKKLWKSNYPHPLRNYVGIYLVTLTLTQLYVDEFCQYFRYSKSLRFEDKPDYSNLRRMFKDLFYRNNYDKEVIFDWTILHVILRILKLLDGI